MEEVSGGFRFLDRNAAAAVDGTLPKAAEAFEHVGVSTDFLKEHLGNSGEIFDAVLPGSRRLPTAAERPRGRRCSSSGGAAKPWCRSLISARRRSDDLAETMAGLGAMENHADGRNRPQVQDAQCGDRRRVGGDQEGRSRADPRLSG